MSIVSQLIAAFKKGAEGKDPNWPPPNTGPRDVPGTDFPQDDGREFRNPPQDPLPPTGTGGVQPPVASGNNADTKAPPEPLPPSEPGPIEGDGGGTPTPPSAPFNPVEVVFKQAGGGSAPRDFKIEDSPVLEDPDAGGEVADRKADIDSAFVRRLRFSPDTEPSVQSSDPEEGGEVVARPRAPLDVKGENTGIIEDPDAGGEGSGGAPTSGTGSFLSEPDGVRLKPEAQSPQVRALRPAEPDDDSGNAGSVENAGIVEDPDAGGEVFSKVKFKIESADLKFGEYKVEPDYKPEGDWKVEDGIKFEVPGSPGSPPGSPIPYPNVEGDGDDLAESLARKAGGAQQEFFKVKMEEVMVTSARTGSEPLDEDEPPDDEGSGVTDWIAKKRGKGGLGFLDEQAGEAPVTREAFDGIKGESQDKYGEIAFARRTEVKDAHDRFSDTTPDTPAKPSAQLIDDDDDFESSSLLDLKPEADVKAMLPGLAGELPDDAELDFDLDDDLDDTDESEL